MVNEEKVKLMNKMALYEEKYEKRISRSLLTIKRIMSAIRRFLPLSGSRLVMWFCLEYLRRHLWRPF